MTMLGDPNVLRPLVEATKWKFSCIDGDVVLGDGLKCYATRLFNARHAPQTVLAWLNNTADKLANGGANVVRRKMEHVIYDDRNKDVRPECCSGGCVECHLDDIPQERGYFREHPLADKIKAGPGFDALKEFRK